MSFSTSPYPQCSVNLCNSAIQVDTLLFRFVNLELNLHHSAIKFGCDFLYCVMRHLSSSRLLSPCLAGEVNPLNSLYIAVPQELRKMALFLE